MFEVKRHVEGMVHVGTKEPKAPPEKECIPGEGLDSHLGGEKPVIAKGKACQQGLYSHILFKMVTCVSSDRRNW